MLSKFEVKLTNIIFKFFRYNTGYKILKVIYRIYYGIIYYPQIYWLRIGTTIMRIKTSFRRTVVKIIIFVIEKFDKERK